MKKSIFLILAVSLVLFSCSKENLDFDTNLRQINQENSNVLHSKSGDKVSICHNNGTQIIVSAASVDAHLAHGDAVDMDGDGFYDRENSCSPVDCDDTTYSEDNTCGPTKWRTGLTANTIQHYIYTDDNFQTINISISYSAASGTSHCVLNAPLVEKVGNSSYYDAGDFGTVQLAFWPGSTPESPILCRVVSSAISIPNSFSFYFYNVPMSSVDCLPFSNPWEDENNEEE